MDTLELKELRAGFQEPNLVLPKDSLHSEEPSLLPTDFILKEPT